MIIGTAGHVDHGKTALIKALTGVETDRLLEEQRRGITLDLGYAYQASPSGEVLGFIDVPGHEKLIHNMLAGATGIDFVLLVIAADDGPMPQTREHLQIVELLGLHQGAVVITKADLVDAARLQSLQDELQTWLAPTALAGAPRFVVSAHTGMHLEALRQYLHQVASSCPARPADGYFRLAIDRCFTLSGTGTVVTGTVHSGQVQVGDQLLLSPSGQPVRIRGLHAQNRPAATGRAGQRCALNLVGPGLDRMQIRRGDWLLHPELHHPTERLDVWLRVLGDAAQPLRHWSPVHVHLGAADGMGRVALLEADELYPGDTGLAQLILEGGHTHALHGDRFILRDSSARHTLAGGWVLDDAPPARGRRRPERLATLRAGSAADPSVALVAMLPLSPYGIPLREFARLRNRDATWVTQESQQPGRRVVATPAGPVAFSPEHWMDLQQRILSKLADVHQQHPERLGPDREQLRRLVAPRSDRPVFAALLEDLVTQGKILLQAPWIHLPDHQLTLAPSDAQLWLQEIQPLLLATPFNPPRVRDLARGLHLEEERVRRLLRQLVGMGEVHRVAHDHFFSRSAVAELAAIAQELSETHGKALAAPFRDRIGTGRKVAIQILEFFDRIGYTRRVGDEHRVYPDSLLRLR